MGDVLSRCGGVGKISRLYFEIRRGMGRYAVGHSQQGRERDGRTVGPPGSHPILPQLTVVDQRRPARAQWSPDSRDCLLRGVE